MKKASFLVFAIVILVVGACSSSDSGGGDPTPMGGDDDDPMTVSDPSAATLLFPENNAECNEGAVLNDLESNLTFDWNASQNTDSYLVTLTNLNNGATFETMSNTNEATIIIARGTPYEWSVTSRAEGTNATAKSATWRFYNEGPGIENYAPFPADAINPSQGAILTSTTTMVSLEWSAGDVDDDIRDFEVFFGLQNETPSSLGVVTTSSFEVTVETGNIYEWKVIVTDSQENSSTSETFEFSVE